MSPNSVMQSADGASVAPEVRQSVGGWAWRRLIASLKRYGVRETVSNTRKTLREFLRQYLNHRFDRKYHVQTTGLIQLRDLTCNSVNRDLGIWYEPTPVRTVEAIFCALPPDVSDFTFIDFGSGKGRTLLVASNYTFRRIIGVEFGRELHEVAEKNFRTYLNPRQRCFDLSSICIDATRFVLPEENCVLYFFHPFQAEVLEKVLENIERSYRAHPRKLIMLYYHPQMNDVLQRFTFLHKTGEVPMPFDLSAEPCPYRRKLEVYETELEVRSRKPSARPFNHGAGERS